MNYEDLSIEERFAAAQAEDVPFGEMLEQVILLNDLISERVLEETAD